MTERRRHPRRRTLKAGKIVFNQGFSSFDCTVRNMSNQGACLDVAIGLGIPDRFELKIEADRFVRMCRVVWRTDRRIGVSFL